MGKAGAWEDLAEVCRSAGGSSSTMLQPEPPQKAPDPQTPLQCSACCWAGLLILQEETFGLHTQSVQRTRAGILSSDTTGARFAAAHWWDASSVGCILGSSHH